MSKNLTPDIICHYYEKSIGPLVNLSDLVLEDAEAVLDEIRRNGDTFAAKRNKDYLSIRFDLEDKARALFIAKGGKPVRHRPHYFTLGSCLNEFKTWWFKECEELVLPLSSVSSDVLSFTYGDLFPCMFAPEDKPWRRQVYTLEEIGGVVDQYGLPQKWNYDGKQGIERYIEVQLWADVR